MFFVWSFTLNKNARVNIYNFLPRQWTRKIRALAHLWPGYLHNLIVFSQPGFCLLVYLFVCLLLLML